MLTANILCLPYNASGALVLVEDSRSNAKAVPHIGSLTMTMRLSSQMSARYD